MFPKPIIAGLLLAAVAVVFIGLLLWLSGDWRWVEGWIFVVWWVSFFAFNLVWLRSRDPALLAERMRIPGTGGESRSDLAILIGIKVCGLAWIVVPALDVRFGWTPRLPLWCEICGGILLLGGSFPFFRAFTDNTFASQLVRIQTERGQHVIDTGVYGFVRHPMYLGASLVFFGGALLLGSISGLLWASRCSGCSWCASLARKSCWHAIWRATRNISRRCVTGWYHTSGKHHVSLVLIGLRPETVSAKLAPEKPARNIHCVRKTAKLKNCRITKEVEVRACRSRSERPLQSVEEVTRND